MTTSTNRSRLDLEDPNGFVFGGYHGRADNHATVIIDVDRYSNRDDITVITVGEVDYTPGTRDGVVRATGTILLTPDETDLLIARLIERSSGERNRVDGDLWGQLVQTRRKVLNAGGNPPAVEEAWVTHGLKMKQCQPSSPDDVEAMRLKWGATRDEIALVAHLADRNRRCEEAVRRVLAVAGPLTFERICRHPEWNNEFGVAASLTAVLRAGERAGWLVRQVSGWTSRWALADAATVAVAAS